MGFNSVFKGLTQMHHAQVKVKFALKQATKAQSRGAEVYLYSFFNLGTRCGWVVNATPWPLYPRERTGILCIGGWVGLRAGLDGH